MSNPFILGEFVELNTPNAPSQHGRRGIVTNIESEQVKGPWLWSPMITEFKISVSVQNDDRFITYCVSPGQLLKTKNDPAFDKFKNGFLANAQKEAEQQKNEFDVEQETIVKEANDHLRVHKIGYREGYDQGWKDAIAHVLSIFDKHGFNGEIK